MKSIKYGIWLLMLLALTACGGGTGDDGPGAAPAVQELRIGQSVRGYIDQQAEINTFRLRANANDRFLKVNVSEPYSPTGDQLENAVDLLVIVEEERDGQRFRLYGRHEVYEATQSAAFDLWIYVDRPKDLVITIRDLMSDDASSIPYYIRATYEDTGEDNHDISNARPMAIGAADPLSDSIAEVGEEDCFSFEPDTDGVYAVKVEHHKTSGISPVQLAMYLYDHNGNRIQRLSDPQDTILAHLTQAEGPYFVIVEDADSSDRDAGSPYDISVEAVAADEFLENDDSASATEMPAVAQVYTAAGAVEYGCSSTSSSFTSGADADWYSLNLSGPDTYHWMALTIDDGDTIEGATAMRVSVMDSDLDVITTYDFIPGSEAYQNQFRLANGEYYISVAAANSKKLDRRITYRVQLEDAGFSDTHEASDRNIIGDAFELSDGTLVQDRFVSYPSDVDWYKIAVDTSLAPQVLSVDFDTAGPSVVDYQVAIYRSDGVTQVKRVTDADGSDGATQLKTSIMVTETAEYFIRVGDAQNNEGSDTAYSIRASIEAVPGTVAPVAGITTGTLHYYHETAREEGEAASVELEYYSTDELVYKANTEWLDFRSVTPTTDGDGNPVMTLPWICGYIDYHGDRDFFQLDFDKLNPAGSETEWYYDVEIRMVVPSGSEVEYVWKLYRDGNINTGTPVIRDDPESDDGYKACDGDTTPQSTAAVDVTLPDAGSADPERNAPFWIGSNWPTGNSSAKFYIGISDFNYLLLPADESENPLPDDDWGYDAPYYFQVKLTYHEGQAHPN